MKKALYSTRYLIAASLLASSVCMAGTSSPFEVAMHCEQVSKQLEQLTYSSRNVPCVENIALSATYMDTAAKNMYRFKTPQALMHLNFASKELNDMYTTPQCAYFVPKIKPYLTTLTQLKVEIEMLDPYQLSKSSGQK